MAVDTVRNRCQAVREVGLGVGWDFKGMSFHARPDSSCGLSMSARLRDAPYWFVVDRCLLKGPPPAASINDYIMLVAEVVSPCSRGVASSFMGSMLMRTMFTQNWNDAGTDHYLLGLGSDLGSNLFIGCSNLFPYQGESHAMDRTAS